MNLSMRKFNDMPIGDRLQICFAPTRARFDNEIQDKTGTRGVSSSAWGALPWSKANPDIDQEKLWSAATEDNPLELFARARLQSSPRVKEFTDLFMSGDYPTLAAIAHKMGVSVTRVRGCLAELRDAIGRLLVERALELWKANPTAFLPDQAVSA